MIKFRPPLNAVVNCAFSEILIATNFLVAHPLTGVD